MSSSLRALQPNVEPLARAFIRYLATRGIAAQVTSTRRDPDVQRQLYADYLAGRSRYPAAPPGRSTHATGIAFDMILNGKSPGAVPGARAPWEYQFAGAVWKRLGLTWGGDFHDPIHFDVRRRG